MIGELAATGDPLAAPSLKALSDGRLVVRKSDGGVFVRWSGPNSSTR